MVSQQEEKVCTYSLSRSNLERDEYCCLTWFSDHVLHFFHSLVMLLLMTAKGICLERAVCRRVRWDVLGVFYQAQYCLHHENCTVVPPDVDLIKDYAVKFVNTFTYLGHINQILTLKTTKLEVVGNSIKEGFRLRSCEARYVQQMLALLQLGVGMV